MNIYLQVRKTHRVLVLVMMVSTLIMSITGMFMKYPGVAKALSVDPRFVNSLHSATSPFFSIILLTMMISGAVMYFYPVLNRRKKTND